LTMGFSSLLDDETIYNASLMVVFAIRVAIVIFVGIRLVYHFGETTPKPSLLFALNLIRLLFIFVYVILHGTGSLDYNEYPIILETVILIIILFLTSVKIEYPQNSGVINVEVMTVNTIVIRRVPAGVQNIV